MVTSPEVGASKPSKISIVVVFPAPFGPSRPKHSPGWNFQIQAAYGFYFAVVGFAKIAALDGCGHFCIVAKVRFFRPLVAGFFCATLL